ncbi:hypothetical protein SASPL_111006 [Salvia splendens]|uniref:K Homology domain-containing protein n=1 Tax=Salvia splendens TaxID=180675 RepID=A0A8X8Y9Y1_SALSN|nr:hypothetical protein SASPL_111006 [Salvia splendens]
MESKSSMPSSSLIDQQVPLEMYGPLKDGLMFETTTGLSRRLLSSPTCPVLESLGKKIGFEISVSLNGKSVGMVSWDPFKRRDSRNGRIEKGIFNNHSISQILVYISQLDNIEDMESEAMISKDMKVDEGLARQGSITKSSCLCSPTTHAASLQRTKSIESASDSQSKDTALLLLWLLIR